ncbi:hypothetical protein AGOR_G00122180 [Albula goreensis]|uniref:Multidrug and toxin extrusion protein n=1 Tax=Albula goreensis TaxID=1534307 RepID=A0A8T3DAT4_9TELE|nr:hypothetical protein AGOR_G00122180 [Albula goreensis]
MEEVNAGAYAMNGRLYSGRNTFTNSNSSPTAVYSGCLRRLRAWIPINYKNEIAQLSKLAVPVFIAQLMIYCISLVSTVFCGHLGKTELAAVSLAVSIINVTSFSFGFGLASACDTFMSQTFGSNNLKRVGVILQRAILILLLACCPCWAILINTESILLAVRQDPDVAKLSQLYVKIFMPALPAAFLYQLQERYLQNQGIQWPQVITGVVTNVLNALINFLFLFVLDLGVVGSAAANCISQYCLVALLYGYIRWRDLHKATWAGWSTECLQEWGAYIRVAVPSMFMLCLEWWIYEIGYFLAGLISEVELGAQSIVYAVSNVAYMFPYGFSIAASVRVGNALGAGNTQQALVTSKLSILCAVMVSTCVATVIGASKDVIGYIFTNDVEIRKRTGEAMVLYAPFHLFDAIAAVAGGIVRGAAKQKVGAIGNLVGFYFVGYPIGVSLMFAAKLGITGLWMGLLICVFVQACFFVIFIAKLDWKKATDEALVRAGVRTAEQIGDHRHTQGGQSYLRDRVEEQGSWEFSSDMEQLEERELASGTVAAELSFTQLLLRRGLAVCVMLFILAIGIITNLLLTSVT